ncbi:hypothetical protein GCM10022254_75480 [Actinomadura meridiana]|uniref:Uncharacterized protein n=1 Tax=Actinomadura meridiana TaxID=559626 RepID=A0ABP8CRA2_9ACTN
MNDRINPARISAPVLASPPRQAAQLLDQRILILERPRFVTAMPALVNTAHSGLVLCDAKAARHTAALRPACSGLLLEDQSPYEKQIATADAPFDLPADVLFGGELGDVLDEQRRRGADLAIAPTRYVQAGDSDALKAIMRTAAELERDDVLIPLPVAVTWLMNDQRRQLAAVIRRIPHPVALILGGQRDPLRHFTDAPQNLRAVLADLHEVGPVGLWRTDLAGFDALAHGAAFAGIGAGGSVRHLVPAGERAESAERAGGPNWPSVLVPDLMIYKRADTLERIYANDTAPPCTCRRCGNSPLPSFHGATDAIKADAHAHNTATWTAWLPNFLGNTGLSARQAWWRTRCRRAVDAHELENTRLRQPKAFKPTPVLKQWAREPTA